MRLKEVTHKESEAKFTIAGLTVEQGEKASNDFKTLAPVVGTRQAVMTLWVLPSLNNQERQADAHGILGPIPENPEFTPEKLAQLDIVIFDWLFQEILDFNGMKPVGEEKATA